MNYTDPENKSQRRGGTQRNAEERQVHEWQNHQDLGAIEDMFFTDEPLHVGADKVRAKFGDIWCRKYGGLNQGISKVSSRLLEGAD